MLGLTLPVAAQTQQLSADRPNILLCMADDWGWPHAGAYGDKTLKTPNFDRLAREGALFLHAYACAPTCTASRNGIITGKYPWQLGPGMNLWSSLPIEHDSFIHLLRDGGYFTGRSSHKQWGPGRIGEWAEHHGDHPATTQYKKIDQFLEAYDKQREAADQPFFYWLAAHDPHRGFRKGQHKNSAIDPDKVQVFEHFPNVPEIREDIADYYFAVQRWDRLVGTALKQLEERGLLENTIVIMTGDHGMPFPRGKANLYDSGTRVPLAVRWGVRVQPNRRIDTFVSLADLGPTLLELGGVVVPKDMNTLSFADVLTQAQISEAAQRARQDIIFGRERHTPSQHWDSMVGYPSRGLRNKDFLYIRNYAPDRWPIGTMERVNDDEGKPGPFLSDCDPGPSKTYIYENRDLDAVHRRAFELCFGKRPAHELYDLKKDPGQVNNVAGDPAYAETLAQMQARLQQRLEETKDPRASDPDYTGFDPYPYYARGRITR